MTSTMRDKIEYAELRALETGKPYLVTGYGNVLLDCASNRQMVTEDEGFCGIAYETQDSSREAAHYIEGRDAVQ